ncbi:MAG TPA: permease-like cell division protein FtsX [Acidimicrobiia bacterium]|nr:permease-like cell division protein FtsX [Acidimicrobiia bacterium]
MWTRVAYFSRETLVSLRRNVLMTIAGIATVAVSLALFGGILMLSKWVDHGTERIKGGVTLEIFMTVDATQQQIDDVKSALEADSNVKTFRFLDKAAAYEEFQRIFKRNPELVQSIEAKDLPTSFRVAPKKAELTPTVQSTFQTSPGVDSVKTPGEALKGLIDVTNTVRFIFIVISLVLLGSSLFLIVNTIRLATFARRREIEVMKLVGASNWFVRIPFIAEGMVQGLVGAGLAILAVLALKHFGFDDAFNDRESFFSEFYVTSGDTTLIAFYVLAIGALIGVVGASVGLRRFLRT